MKKLLLLILTVLSHHFFSQNFAWAKSLGNAGEDDGFCITVDAIGNSYTTGFFKDTVDFDPGPGTYTLAAVGYFDIFILKLDANGNFIWAKQVGGVTGENPQSITLDGLGNIYVMGLIDGLGDFDPGPSTYTLTSAGNHDIFILKLDPSGNFIWAKNMGGIDDDRGNSIVVDSIGNVYTTGSFYGSAPADFDPGPSTYTLAPAGNTDGFISKLNPSGNFVWAKRFGAAFNDYGNSLALDNSGNLYLGGNFSAIVDFDPDVTINTVASNGGYDAFVLKLDTAGHFIWIKTFGGTSTDNVLAIAYDKATDVLYMIGNLSGIINVGSGTTTTPIDFYIFKMNASGNLIWAKNLNGTGNDIPWSVCADRYSNVYVTGNYDATVDFDPGAGTQSLTSNGMTDIFILKLDSAGNYMWAKSMGGIYPDYSWHLTADNIGNIYATGFYFDTVDFDPNAGIFNLTANGNNEDIFILKLSSQTTSIKELSSSKDLISIYPNPNNGTFNVVAKEKMSLNVIDNIGQIVQSIELNEANGYQQTIQIHTSGIYYINGFTEQSSIKQKIIVTQ